jgi:sulfite reductase (NADPH) flavoprotein alpha-component
MGNEIAVYYGTMTGNAEDLASETVDRLTKLGFASKSLSLEDQKVEDLTKYPFSLFIVSTWGDGEPPEDAYDFWDSLDEGEHNLNSFNYGIMGLGDESYDEFNAFARNLDKRLTDFGGNRYGKRVEADVFYDEEYETWFSEIAKIILTLPLNS